MNYTGVREWKEITMISKRLRQRIKEGRGQISSLPTLIY